ncbi:hypothetical protein P4O66_015329 [Electrophorus voltai]|uniref:Catenin alpha-1 n=1 Tax=Electrophorus voltai TaxID=2609070 RepID=A0AAD8YZ13_9TELE|nr:hypothetical protein P4O66_015329 [Electrophorus voltai]
MVEPEPDMEWPDLAWHLSSQCFCDPQTSGTNSNRRPPTVLDVKPPSCPMADPDPATDYPRVTSLALALLQVLTVKSFYENLEFHHHSYPGTYLQTTVDNSFYPVHPHTGFNCCGHLLFHIRKPNPSAPPDTRCVPVGQLCTHQHGCPRTSDPLDSLLLRPVLGEDPAWQIGAAQELARACASVPAQHVFFSSLRMLCWFDSPEIVRCVDFRAELEILGQSDSEQLNMTSINTANINFKWDPKSLEIRTLAVERLLEPLVTQVTTLVNSSNKGPSNKKKGRSKKAHVLAASVETATQNFLEKGEKIARESQFLKEELTAAVEDVRKQGESMRQASGEFVEDPCSSVKRGNMVRAARALLSAVTHLLVLADMADVYQLLLQLKLVEESLMKVRNAGTEQDLGIHYKALKPEVDKLNLMAAKRQQELKDVHHKDQMAAARGVLQRNVPMLYTASRACLQHPDVAAYKANRDLIYKQLQHAVSGISNAAQATSSEDPAFSQPAGGGELAGALNNFDKQIIVDPMSFSEERFRPSLEERLESIISGAALMADSSCTRDDRRERIVAECNSVRQALQDLLSEYMGNQIASGKSICLPEPCFGDCIADVSLSDFPYTKLSSLMEVRTRWMIVGVRGTDRI